MKTNSSRNWMNVWAIAVIFACSTGVAVAQQTNVSMVTHFALSGFAQTGDSTVGAFKITNKDILNALNATGRLDFSSSAQIIMLSFEGQLPNFAVREGSGDNVTTTDISSYFSLSEPGEVHTANHVSYAIYEYSFDNRNGTSFTVSGMTTLHAGTIKSPGIAALFRDRTLTSTVGGSGNINGDTVVMRGTISGGSPKR